MKVVAFAALLVATSLAHSEEYICRVNCVGPSGQTSVSVSASSASDAASKVDRQSDQICRRAGHDRSTSSSMSASQCERK
jgi:hypothetical protein